MIRDIVREGRTDHSEKLMGKIATLNIAAVGSRLSVKEPVFLLIEYRWNMHELYSSNR